MKSKSKPASTTHLTTGQRALAVGDLLTAQSEFAAVLADDPNSYDAMGGIAIIMMNTQRPHVALRAARECTAIDPENPEAWFNLGMFAAMLGGFEEAVTAFQRAVVLAPDRFEVWKHLGLARYSLGRFNEAEFAYGRALEIKPDDEDAIDQLSNVYLAQGRFREGFLDNKVRWKIAASHPLMHHPLPEWKGESLVGKTIMVLHEQGYGDSLQFVRLVPWLKTKFGAARVILSMRDSMVGLMKLAGVADEVIEIRQEPKGGLDSVDFKCPMLTVPGYVGLSVENIPTGPYLKAPMRQRLLPKGKFKIGIVWGGVPMYAQDAWRSMYPTTLLPLTEIEGVALYSLQQDERRRELWESGMNAFVSDLSPHLGSWLDTAAIVAEMDLVVSVDTSVAHLAGAIGKPVGVLIPQASCWRWMGHETKTTAWYPTMKLFRQRRQGDWTPAVDAIKDHIRDILA